MRLMEQQSVGWSHLFLRKQNVRLKAENLSNSCRVDGVPQGLSFSVPRCELILFADDNMATVIDENDIDLAHLVNITQMKEWFRACY